MVYIFLAAGFEEIEALATADILRRAELEVVTVGIGGRTLTGSHGITVIADIEEKDMILSDKIEAIVLPGGMPGTLGLEKSMAVQAAIAYANEFQKYICAICAAPSILGHLGLLDGVKATCFPGYETQLGEALFTGNNVELCGKEKIITAKGAGVTLKFALEIVEVLKGQDTANKIRQSMQCV